MSRNIRTALSGAACALLAQSQVLAENPHDIGDWDFSSALLVYSEVDRVSALEPVLSAKKYLDTDESITFKLTFDTLTGASGTGAVPALQAQTYSRPSGGGSYSTGNGDIPLDDTFEDDRVALNLTWNKPSFGSTQAQYGFSVSDEYDYRSLGASATWALNLNNANTTISSGIALAQDAIAPVGGVPIVFANASDTRAVNTRAKSESKSIADILVGITQVIDQNSLIQFNYSLSIANGYMNDPYKVLSVVDNTTGAPLTRVPVGDINSDDDDDDENNNGPAPVVLFENRPDSRIKNSLFARYKRYLSGNVLDASYRFMTDSWGVVSNTLDLKYRIGIGKRQFIQPHIRLYHQSAADFYTPFIALGTEPVESNRAVNASADYRLGEFNGYTIGLEYGQENISNSWSTTLEYYLQTGDEPAGKFGDLQRLTLYPDVSAIMFKLQYDF